MQAKMTTWGYLEVVFHDQNSFLYLLPADKHDDSVKKKFLLQKIKSRHKHAKWPQSNLTPWTLTLNIGLPSTS